VFNGVDVLLIVIVIAAVVAGRWCLRRWDRAQKRANHQAIALEGRDRVRIVYEQTAAEWNSAGWAIPDGNEREAA
jgi:hypothetical protein